MSTFHNAFIGIDVAKATLDISLSSKHFRIKNTCKSIAIFIQNELLDKDISPKLICLESTGGYEVLAIKSFQKVGMPVHRAHPNTVHAFAKTDKLDAKLLEKYACFVSDKKKGDLPKSDAFYELQALRQTECDLMDMIHATQCRIKTSASQTTTYLRRQLNFFAKELKKVRKDIELIVTKNKEFKKKRELMMSIPGVAKQVSNALLAQLPELGNIGKKQIASLVGVAPKTYESGTQYGKGHIYGGRFHVRKALYMAALVATQHNSKMKTFYERLLAAGKAKKVALVAVMRKIIVCLNAMIKNNERYRDVVDI